jgi:hypothetical protein
MATASQCGIATCSLLHAGSTAGNNDLQVTNFMLEFCKSLAQLFFVALHLAYVSSGLVSRSENGSIRDVCPYELQSC